MLAWALATAAWAASPGGFRVGPGVPTSTASLRQVVVAAPPSPFLVQTTARAQVGLGAWSVAAELPVVGTWEPGWRDLGAGQLRVGVRRHTGSPANPLAVVAEVAFPVVPRPWRVSSWGSVARETLPGAEAIAGVEVSGSPRAPWTLRLVGGARSGPYLGDADGGLEGVVELCGAKVVPLAGPLAVVGEAEVLTDLTPASARALLRVDVDGARPWRVDAGVQAPLSAWLVGPPTVQGLAQVAAFW